MEVCAGDCRNLCQPRKESVSWELSWKLGPTIDLYISLSNGQVISAGFHGYMEIHLYFISHKDELGT